MVSPDTDTVTKERDGTMRDMEWYVYVERWSSKQIEKYNIFYHDGFMNDVKKAYKLHKDNFEAFCDMVKRSLMYYFWSKCEWEVIISGWPQSDTFHDKKVDVYDQVMMNCDVFMKYVWDMAHARKIRSSNGGDT